MYVTKTDGCIGVTVMLGQVGSYMYISLKRCVCKPSEVKVEVKESKGPPLTSRVAPMSYKLCGGWLAD